MIYGYGGVRQAYETGRGRVVMRAKMHEEEIRPGRLALIVTEIPYQVNKATLQEKIAHLVREKRLEGISDMRDESDRDGMRIVIELKKDAVSLVVQNHLYKYTALQQTFGVNIVALVNGRPRTLGLKECIRHYVDHRHEVVTRRTQFELRKAEERAHILEGLTIALDHLDAVITIIRQSEDTDAARANLMRGVLPSKLTSDQLERLGLPTHGESMFSLSELQADAILALRLSRLTGLERQKIEEEYRNIIQEIERLKGILDSHELRMQIIKDELREIQRKYADERRTEIDYTGGGDFLMEDFIDDDQVVVSITHQGLIKRTSVGEYRQQGRGGVGMRGTGMRDEDYIEHLFVSNNHDYLLFFTDQGQCHWLRVFEIPEGSRTSKGRSIRNLMQIAPEDAVKAVMNLAKSDFEDEAFMESHYVMMATRQGLVKKTPLEQFSRPRVDGIIAISIVDGDELLEAHLTDGEAHIILASSGGRSVRFHESDARPMGRNTRGVRGIALGKGEETIGMVAIKGDDADDRRVLAISANGYGKRSVLDDYRVQSRGGKGIITIKTTRKTGPLVSIKGVCEDDEPDDRDAERDHDPDERPRDLDAGPQHAGRPPHLAQKRRRHRRRHAPGDRRRGRRSRRRPPRSRRNRRRRPGCRGGVGLVSSLTIFRSGEMKKTGSEILFEQICDERRVPWRRLKERGDQRTPDYLILLGGERAIVRSETARPKRKRTSAMEANSSRRGKSHPLRRYYDGSTHT